MPQYARHLRFSHASVHAEIDSIVAGGAGVCGESRGGAEFLGRGIDGSPEGALEPWAFGIAKMMPRYETLLPAQADAHWEHRGVQVIGVGVMVATLDVKPGMVEGHAVGQAAAEVVTRGIDGTRRKSLSFGNHLVGFRDSPQRIYRLPGCALHQYVAGSLHRSPIKTNARNRVSAPFAMGGNGEDAVQGERLQAPTSVSRQELILDHAVFEREVVVHVLGVDAEPPAEIHAAARSALVGLSGELADITQAAAESATHIEIETVELLCGGRAHQKHTQGN